MTTLQWKFRSRKNGDDFFGWSADVPGGQWRIVPVWSRGPIGLRTVIGHELTFNGEVRARSTGVADTRRILMHDAQEWTAREEGARDYDAILRSEAFLPV